MARMNPFFELYVGDTLSSREFVDIFSPFLVPHAEALFLPGNIVVKGVQGSGKSMLLSLLKPEVRMEYEAASASFPIPTELSNFIGAGINLAHSNGIDFGYRSISDDPNETALFFADFVNSVVMLDLLKSLRRLAPTGVRTEQPYVNIEDDRQGRCVDALVAEEVFQGTLDGCRLFADIEGRLRTRLNAYRRFLHLNDKTLDSRIQESKTDIGTPLSEAVGILKETGVIDSAVSVLIHIDQYEELANISHEEVNSPDYRRVINRALARRDPSISYRIGTRGHAWRNHGFIFGAEAKLEEDRDYKFVDLDLILRRHENRKTWIFPRFVEDVFARRLMHVRLAHANATGRELLGQLFGPSMSPSDKAVKYGGGNRGRSVKADRNWPDEFKDGLRILAEDDPLSARLLEAWALQQLDRSRHGRRTVGPADLNMGMLEEMRRKQWWIKERIDLALVQIAGRCQQRPIWSGYPEIIDLSGGNILTFLSICQNIWAVQDQLGAKIRQGQLGRIETEIQAVGIFKASEYWLNKISQETGRSGDRSRMAREIGNVLARRLYSDRQMSYPGHNGFSLADDELDRFPHVKELLEEMSDYGTVVSWPHTTKEKDRRSRHKFYLNPVLCPGFKLHYKRLKEPAYIHPTEVERWMQEAGLPLPPTYRPRVVRDDVQSLPLFDHNA